MAGLLALASPVRWGRFARLPIAERRLLVEAAARIASAVFLARLASFSRVIRSGAVPLGSDRLHDPEAISRAVRLAAKTVPFRAMCLEQGIACQAMLRRRGVDARLHYGAAAGENLEAHVWVTVGERIVIGSEEAARFRSVACFPE